METMKNDTTPKWKEMAQQLKVDCVRSEILEECTRRVRTVGSNAGNIQEKISDALNVALSMRKDTFMALVMELTDLDANAAGELIQQLTQHISHLDIARRLECCSEPPIVKYGFGWWFTFAIHCDCHCNEIPF